MSGPDYLLCVACETPCYQFDWVEGEVTAAFCPACGNDEIDQFLTEEEMEALTSEGGVGESH